MKRKLNSCKTLIAFCTLLISFTACKKLEGSTAQDSVTKASNKKTADVWTEIFRDDFTTLDTSKWYITNRVDYNSPLCTYSPAGVSIGSYDLTNCLVLTATKPGSANAYNSGHIKSKSTFKPALNQKYWFSSRIKLIAIDGTTYKSFNQTYGAWPAFWTTNESYWPTNGEIDIMEGYSYAGTERYSSNLFYGVEEHKNLLGTSCEREYTSGDGWHNYDMFWINVSGAVTIVVLLDGVTVATYTNSSHTALQLENFSPQNILFNLCVGGGMFNNSTINVMTKTMMWVDWVSVSSSPV